MRAPGSTKFASSEDGFQYFYTAVDPATENFTLTATFRVDDAAAKDNQSGFGVIAVDDLVAGSSPDRYFNSAGALVTRYGEGTVSVVDGMPGARFVNGYTGATDDNTAGARDASGSAVFDPAYRAEASGPKFATGDTYTLSLRRSNTGFHAVWDRSADGGEVHEVIEYDPDALLVQDGGAFYVGMAVARKIAVTVTDWEFTTIDPSDDEPAQPRPIEQVSTSLKVDVTSTTPEREPGHPARGRLLRHRPNPRCRRRRGGRRTRPRPRGAGARHRRTRAGRQPLHGPRHPRRRPAAGWTSSRSLASMDPVDEEVTVTVRSYGEPGQSLWVAPDGTADGDGTRARPLDLHTAVAFAQAGQQAVLEGGTYTPRSAIVADRGHDGTEAAPIVLMSEPGERAVLDLSGSSGGGINLRADWWHVYNLEITGSRDKAKPMLVQGHHNIVERVESHHNQDTGIQISGLSAEPPSMWPSDNLVVSSIAHHNADAGGNDADGFAAKAHRGRGKRVPLQHRSPQHRRRLGSLRQVHHRAHRHRGGRRVCCVQQRLAHRGPEPDR
ncbi:hypothetical protein [Demequina litorisediminis]|uniref:Pectate disaccharide-lyase-like N-terminal domain-containing protein n=1 Tax=Demequina litorisediminis TaxID=1849022 RepID=A0ABQ6IFK5_9MICO|nr:hypothetical protein [Demequina litorisediminis]GMA36545.1 hypothetical protein GCM10025876_27490 [Demequina litorisediminis]